MCVVQRVSPVPRIEGQRRIAVVKGHLKIVLRPPHGVCLAQMGVRLCNLRIVPVTVNGEIHIIRREIA